MTGVLAVIDMLGNTIQELRAQLEQANERIGQLQDALVHAHAAQHLEKEE